MNRVYLTILGVLTCSALLTFGCMKEKSPKQVEVNSNVTNLVYEYETITPSGATQEGSMSAQSLWNCANHYCSFMHTNYPRYSRTGLPAPNEFVLPPDEYKDYRKYLCLGDLLSNLSDAAGTTDMERYPDFAPMIDVSNFNLESGCGFEMIESERNSMVQFLPLETLDQREEVKELATRAYYSALSKALEFVGSSDVPAIDTQELRNHLYDSPGDSWFYDTDENSKGGENLALQMFASIPSLVNELVSIKFSLAEERAMEGAARGDQWGDSSFGRPASLRHLYGNYSCESDEVKQPGANTCWKKCPFGQTWNASQGTCTGTAVSASFADALNSCSGIGMRLPTAMEFAELFSDGEVVCPVGSEEPCGPCMENPVCGSMFEQNGLGNLWTSTAPEVDYYWVMHTGSGEWGIYSSGDPTRFVCVHENPTIKDIEILPANNASIPEMTQSLSQAIGLLDRYEIFFPYYVESFYESTDQVEAQGFFDTMKETLRQRVNVERNQLGMTPFASIEDVAEEYLTSPQGIEDAARYMYSHMILFPRKNGIEASSNSGGFETEPHFYGWSSAIYAIPARYHARGYDNSGNGAFSGYPSMAEGSGVGSVGVSPLAKAMMERLLDAKNKFSAISGNEEDAELQLLGLVEDALDQSSLILGNSRIEYEIKNSELTKEAIFKLINPSVVSVGLSDKVVEHILIYPIGKESDGVSQFDNMVCFEEGGCLGFYFYVLSSDVASCTATTPAVTECNMSSIKRCTYIETESGIQLNNCPVVETVDIGNVENWAVLWSRAESAEDAVWETVDIIENDNAYGGDGDIVVEGSLKDSMFMLATFDPSDINVGLCDAMSSLNGDCIDRDWVPAIENEVNTDGSEYESSYRVYLENAKTAAAQAKLLREAMISDIIDEAQAEVLQKAKLDEAVDTYLSSIREICGDDTRDEFETWVQEALADESQGISFSDSLESNLNREYSCEVLTHDPNDISPTNSAKVGPVHCAVELECDTYGTSLEEIGLLDGITSSRGNTCSPDFQFSVDELLNPVSIIKKPNFDGYQDYGDMVLWLARLKCWAAKYKILAKNFIEWERLYYLPTQFASSANSGNGIDFFENDLGGDTTSAYGSYYSKLEMLVADIEALEVSIKTYLSEFDSASAMVEEVEATINATHSQMNFETASALTGSMMSEAQYQSSKELGVQQCIEQVNHDYENIITLDAIKTSMDTVKDASAHNFRLPWGSVSGPLDFVQLCSQISATVSWPDPRLKQIYCEEMETNRRAFPWGGTWNYDGNISPVPETGPVPVKVLMKCIRKPDYAYCDIRPFYVSSTDTSETHAAQIVDWSNAPELFVSLRCIADDTSLSYEHANRWNHLEMDEDSVWSTYHNCVDGGGSGYYLNFESKENIASNVRQQLWDLDLEACAFPENTPKTDKYETMLEDSVLDWQCPNGRFCKMKQEVAFLQDQAANSNLVGRMIDTGSALSKARLAISEQLSNVRRNIGDLRTLEDKQVSLYRELINGRNLSKSSSYTNLAEWQERYSFTKKQYQKQLNRARLAAWIARRSIEFRFGIDLATEYTPTIYGDIPANWADTIYDTVTTICGEPQEGDNSNISGCLTPEHRIEEYVEKLEDYVGSYGNNPNDDWWFHEDDDTGVLSLRDDIAYTETRCSKETNNLLFFTEEFDMENSKWLVDYSDIEAVIGDEPSTWVLNNIEFTKNLELLGLPEDVEVAHDTIEREIFDDWFEEYTADLIQLDDSSFPGSIAQTITAEDIVDSVWSYNDLNFSTYLRRNSFLPEGTQCPTGTVYSRMLGVCAIECTVTELNAPYGTCLNGQVCVDGGTKIVDPLTGEEDNLRVCNWCAADGGCIHQNGTAIGMEIEDNIAGLKSSRNVNVYPYWSRASVDTYTNVVDTNLSTVEQSVTVKVKNITTENLVEFSESGSNWTGVSFTSNTGIAPNYTENALTANFPTGSTLKIPASNLASLTKGVTGSVWLRTTGTSSIDDVEVVLTTQADVEIRKSIVSVGSHWTRYVVESDSVPSLSTELRITAPSGGEIQVWGAQIEEGMGATPYVATNKNYLINSDFSSGWTISASILAHENSSVVAPDGTVGATSYEDTNSNYAAIHQTVTEAIKDAHLNETYTFSVWLKNKNPGVQNGLLILRLNYHTPVGEANYIQQSLPVAVTEDWKRFEVTKLFDPDTTDENLAELQAIIYLNSSEPNTGELFVWGPQLEEHGSATGYEPTDASPLDSTTDWGLNLGMVGTQLMPTSGYSCDAAGMPVGAGQSACITTYEGLQSSCCQDTTYWDPTDTPDFINYYTNCMSCTGTSGITPCYDGALHCNPVYMCSGVQEPEGSYKCSNGPTDYVRNTYLKEHYGGNCIVEQNGIDVPHPLPELGEFSVATKDTSRVSIFKQLFQRVEPAQDRPAYYAYQFQLGVDGIVSGNIGQFGVLAPDNFNYRVRTVAANVVGTDVINCDDSPSPSTCAANQWISYDLKQMGEVYIRNHHQQNSVRPFEIPTGRVSGGKAWVAEQVIGFPVSSAHLGALQQLQKVSLMGRPLQGTFELRIYETPELVWENVEDIQLVLGYHYWTRSE